MKYGNCPYCEVSWEIGKINPIIRCPQCGKHIKFVHKEQLKTKKGD